MMIGQLSTVIVKCFLLFTGVFIRGFQIQHLYLYCLSVSTKCLILTSPNKYLFCKFDHPAVSSIIQYKSQASSSREVHLLTCQTQVHLLHSVLLSSVQGVRQVSRHCIRGRGLACPRLESPAIKARFPQCPYSTAHSNETNYHQVLKSDHISPADCT